MLGLFPARRERAGSNRIGPDLLTPYYYNAAKINYHHYNGIPTYRIVLDSQITIDLLQNRSN